VQNLGALTSERRFADIDDDGPERADTFDTVDRLAELAATAGGGRVLELAIGTGRIGLRLADLGLSVHGIEASLETVAELRGKPGGDDLHVTIGNFADVGVDGAFDLIYVVHDMLSRLTTQDEQVRCFENVSAHLSPSGLFAVEARMPSSLHPLHADHAAGTADGDDRWLDVAEHDPVAQVLAARHVAFSPAGIRRYPVVRRYTWPSEMDLMARLAGLSRRERWSGWSREPFTARSESHVSVYGR